MPETSNTNRSNPILRGYLGKSTETASKQSVAPISSYVQKLSNGLRDAPMENKNK
jgi:hypothetical protein